jgi:hypothetical protein
LIGEQGARLLENENQFSSCDVTLSKPSLSCGISGTGETPNGAKRQGGSPPAPRKASNLERKSTSTNSNNDCKKLPKYKKERLHAAAFFLNKGNLWPPNNIKLP